VGDQPPSTLAAEVEAILAGLDEADPDAADAFEAVDAAILAELQRLEAL
jgi:ABC-type Zn uptake system ZnuABC Zn-binding protein ZnuA